MKKSKGRKNNKRAHNIDDIERAKNYGSTHGILLPGHTPRYRRDGSLLTPSNETKIKIYTSYSKACDEKGSVWSDHK